MQHKGGRSDQCRKGRPKPKVFMETNVWRRIGQLLENSPL